MKTFSYVLAGLFLFTASASAEILSLERGNTDIKGVNISNGGTLTVGARSHGLTTIRGCKRTKTILKKLIYVMQMLVTEKNAFNSTNKTTALSSLENMAAVGLHMTFKYDLTAEEIREAYVAGLEANKIDSNYPAMQEFLKAVKNGGDVAYDQTIVIAGEKISENEEVITFQGANGHAVAITGTKGFLRDVYSLWMGETTDGGLSSLQECLVTGK